MTLSPAPGFPENAPTAYEVKLGQNVERRGPLRFEEGVATDTDIPTEFTKGVMQGYITAPGRPNHNANVYEKPAAETLAERAHVGSASWVESQTYLGEFAQGAFNNYDRVEYQEVDRSGGRYERGNAATVQD